MEPQEIKKKIDLLMQKQIINKKDFDDITDYFEILDCARYTLFKNIWPLQDKLRRAKKIYRLLNENNRLYHNSDILTEY